MTDTMSTPRERRFLAFDEATAEIIVGHAIWYAVTVSRLQGLLPKSILCGTPSAWTEPLPGGKL